MTPLNLEARHFATSAFGLAHAERPGQERYSGWSAQVANDMLAAIPKMRSASELFEIGIRARQNFAREFEGVEKPEEDYGAPRVSRSRFMVGEDMMGLGTLTMKLEPAAPLPKDFEGWPNAWWSNIAANPSRTQLADKILRHMVKREGLSSAGYTLLIWDHHYLASTGEVLKSSSTKFQRAYPDRDDSPYFVSTLNAPKPEIEILMNDVHRRIRLALSSREKSAAREHLGHAMYAFFNAMPYYRGSAAIGRIVFTALFAKIEGAPVVIDPECDVKALVSHQFEFRDALSALVRVER